QARVATAAEADGAVAVPFASTWGEWAARLDARLRAEDVAPTKKPFSRQMESPEARRYEAGAGLRVTARALPLLPAALVVTAEARPAWVRFEAGAVRSFPSEPLGAPVSETFAPLAVRAAAEWPRSEERRAGKQCSARSARLLFTGGAN